MNRTRAPLVLAIALAVTAGLAWGYWQADKRSLQVIDGDSLNLIGTRIRLQGIDAPELSQTCTRNGSSWSCGVEARQKLIELIAGRPVQCRVIELDKYSRTLANCYAGSTNLNKEMVRSGYAIAYLRYSNEYASEQLDAMKAKRGIWSGEFETPENYRVRNSAR